MNDDALKPRPSGRGAVTERTIKNTVGAQVSVNIEISTDARSLLNALCQAMEEREIDPEECVGAVGDPSMEGYAGAHQRSAYFEHDNRLHPDVAVIWHPLAIAPPALVLQPDAIIYGCIQHTGG